MAGSGLSLALMEDHPPGPGRASLTPGEIRRYGRHIVMPEVGLEGQERLRAARVVIVGAGGLGSPLALYLAAAGVGTLGLVDFDVVDESNLQRQVAYGTSAVGRLKLDALAERLGDLNPGVRLVRHDVLLSAANALEVLGGYDVVADGTDNFATRYLVNDACVLLGTPNVYGSILRFEGQASVFAARGGPCYRCLYPEAPPEGLVPSCAEAGVFGVLPGVIGSIQATETIKLVTGLGQPLVGRLLLYDALEMRLREMRVRRDPACPVCGDAPSIRELRDDPVGCEVPVGDQLSVRELAAWRERGDDLQLVDVREPVEWNLARLAGATLISLGTLPARLDELDRNRPLVLYCHHGRRSQNALVYLRSQGFTRLFNLAGGIEAWSQEVDPAVPRY